MTSHDLPIEEVRRLLEEDKQATAVADCKGGRHVWRKYYDSVQDRWELRCYVCGA